MSGEQSAAAAAFARQRAAMSVKDASAPEMHVLLVLSVMANEAAQCWPAIRGANGLVAKTGLGERTIARALRGLEANGHVSTRRIEGKGSIYTVHPCHSGSPATAAGVPERQGTPATAATKHPMNNHRKKTSSSSTRGGSRTDAGTAVAVDPYPMPGGVDPQAWTDFLAARKRKRLPNTATAHKTLIDDLTRHATPEWPWPRLIAFAAGRGWASVRNPDREEARHGRPDRPGAGTVAEPRRGFAADMLAAAHARPPDDPAGDPRDRGGVEGEVPAWLRRRS